MAQDNNNCQPNCPCGQYYKEAIEDIRIILDAYISQQEGLDSPELIIGKALDYIKRLTSPERKPPWEWFDDVQKKIATDRIAVMQK